MPQSDVVVDAIGAFGLWQAQSLFLLALVKIPAGWHMLSILFLAPQPETFGGRFWCARPEPADKWDVQEWIGKWHPKNQKFISGYDPCHISHGNHSAENEHIFEEPGQNFTLDECHNFEFFVPRPTMVSEFSLVCNRDFLVNIVQLSYLLGILLGGILTWVLMQKLSPRVILLIGAVLQVIAGIGSAFVPLYEAHCFLKFITGLGVCLMFTAGFQISVDITSGWQKTVVGVCYEHFWSIGVISLGWLNELVKSWRGLQLVISAPTAVILLLFWAIPESPRWLIAQGKLEQAEKLLRSAALVNGKKLDVHFSLQNPQETVPKTSANVPLFKIFCIQVLWIITIFNYYGALLNIRNVGGTSLAIRTTLAGAAELIGATFGLFLLLRSKFKFGVLSLLLLVGGTCCIASWAIEPNERGSRGSWTMVWLALAGRISIACSLAMLSNGASAELIPVPKRPVLMMSLVSVGRLFLQGAPFMNSLSKYGESITLSIYGSLTVTGAIAAFSLFCLNECGSKKKKSRMSNILSTVQQSRSNICHIQQQWHSSAGDLEHSRWASEKIVGVNFNPCFVGDEGCERNVVRTQIPG